MTTITIPVHSFVDLITNSSSEIFVSADGSTVEAVKKLIDSLLLTGGSRFKGSDLFTVALENDKIVVTPKIDSPSAKDAAKILSNLTALFDIDASFDG